MAPRRNNPFFPGMRLCRDAGGRSAHIPQAGDDTCRRMIRIDPNAVQADQRTIELTFSSDVELERWPGIVEVLSHDEGAVDLSRLRNGAQLLFNHDADEYIGVIEDAWIGADRKGHVRVRFSKNEDAEEIWNDIQDGILSNVSVGYRILEVKLAEERENGVDVYRVTRWEPYEVSIVTIPADISVGIGRNVRSLFRKPNHQPKITMNRDQMIAALRARGYTVADDISDADLNALFTRSLAAAPTATPPAAPAAQVTNDPTADDERTRVRTIYAAARQYDAVDLAQEAVEKGHTVDQFRQTLLEHVNKRNQAVVEGTRPIGLSEKEARGFSFVKLIRTLSDPTVERFRKDAAFELDACRAAADQLVHREAKGTVIPTDVLLQPMVTGQRADTIMGAKTASGYTNAGTNNIQTILLTSSFIDLLRNNSVLMQLAFELSGLVGNIDIPKQDSTGAFAWIGEDEEASKSDFDFGLVSLRPRTASNRMELTRKLLMQSSLSVEALCRADMAANMALGIDKAGYYGLGTGNEPKGLTKQSGLAYTNWTASGKPTYAELVGMETTIDTNNALVNGMAMVANAKFRGHAKTTRKFTDGIDGTIWESGNTVNGYRCLISNQLADGDVLFGNWSDFLIGMWGGLDLIVDPYTQSTKGRIRITQFQDVDFTTRRIESFHWGRNTPA